MKMAQYKVLKEHIGFFGDYCAVGDIFTKNTVDPIWIDRGFIEPYTPEPKHWRAENGGRYWYVDENSVVRMSDDNYGNFDNDMYNSNNYFKSQATSELVAKARKLELEWLHDTHADDVKKWDISGIAFDLREYMDEARKAVLEDDSNE